MRQALRPAAGHKAVEAEYEVDGDTWDAFQEELNAESVQGGMSFTHAEYFSELTPYDSTKSGQFALVADASHFTDDAIEQAGGVLTRVGTVRLGRLYQFNAAPLCRVIVEYVRQSAGYDTVAEAVMIGVAGSAIYDALKRLLGRRSTIPTATESQPRIEIHTTTEPDGVSTQRLLLRTDSEEVLRHALDRFADGIARPERISEWDDERDDWVEP